MGAMLRTFTSPDQKIIDSALLKRLDVAAKSDTRTIVLLPSQASFMLERELISRLGGLIQIQVMGWERLIFELSTKLGGRAQSALSQSGFAMLCFDVLRKSELNFLDKADSGTFSRVAKLLYTLKAEGVTPDSLENIENKGKAADILKIWQGVNERGFLTVHDIEKQLIERITPDCWLAGSEVLVYGFDVYSGGRLALISAISKVANTSVYINTSTSTADRLFPEAEELCGKGSNRLSDLAHIFDNLYVYPDNICATEAQNIEVFVAADRAAEVQTVAARIMELSQTCKMRDIVVVTADLPGYGELIYDEFSKNKIPFFLESKRKLSAGALAQTVVAALEVINTNWSTYSVTNYISSGLVPPGTADLLKLCFLSCGLKGYRAKKPFSLDRLAPFEIFRAEVFDPVAQLEVALKSHDCRKKGDALLAFLQTIQVEQNLAQLALEAQAENLADSAAYLAQCFGKFTELLEKLGEIIADDISNSDFAEILAFGMAACEISVVPPKADEVVIGDILHSIYLGKKHIIVLGANSGTLPIDISSGGILDELEAKTLGISNNLSFDEQKQYIRRFITSGDSLILTTNSQEKESFIVSQIRRIFPSLQLKAAIIPNTMPGQLENAAISIFDGTPSEVISSFIYDKAGTQSLSTVSNARRKLPAVLTPTTARALYGTPTASVSRVQNYYSCPYKCFMDKGIEPQAPKIFEENAADIGSFMHIVLDVISRNFADFGSLTDDEIDGIIQLTAAQIAEQHNLGFFGEPQGEYLLGRLCAELKSALCIMRDHFSGTDIKVFSTEQGFGFRGELKVDSTAGVVTVNGIVDRIDIADVNGKNYYRIVDYKSGAGKTDFDWSDWYRGLNMQLIVYIMAVRSVLQKKGNYAEPAGGFYFNIGLPIVETAINDQISDSESDGENGREVRMRGFLIDNPDVARAFDPKKDGKLLSMNLKFDKGGELSGKLMSADELESVFGYTKRLIGNAIGEIYDGKISMTPVSKNGAHCMYCPYTAICDSVEPRNINSLSKDEVLKLI